MQKVKAALHTRSQPIKLTVSHSRRREGGGVVAESQVRNFSKVASDKRMNKNGSRTIIYDLSRKPGEVKRGKTREGKRTKKIK